MRDLKMKDISICITYTKDDSHDIVFQILETQNKFVPEDIKVMDIQFEKEWYADKSRITFKGVEK